MKLVYFEMGVFATKKTKPTINRNNEPLIQRSVFQNNIQRQNTKDADKNKLTPSPLKLDVSSLTRDELTLTMAMIQKMKASKLFSKMLQSLENSSETFKLKMLGATKFHSDAKAGGGMYDPSTNTIYFSLKGYLPELTMAQEIFHAYQDSPEMEKLVVRTNDIESKNSYLITDIEAEGEIATFYMALEVYGSAANNPYYPLFGGELNFKTQTHGTVFDMLTSPTSEQLNSPEFHKLYH
jgi:hypothetical protein